MNDSTDRVRAPQGARGWTASGGYVYDETEMPRRLEGGAMLLVVSHDGYVRGVTERDHAPLAAILRLDGDLHEVVARLDELADELRGRQSAVADRLDQLTRLHAELSTRVGDLGDRAAGLDTSLAVEVAGLKSRVGALEQRT